MAKRIAGIIAVAYTLPFFGGFFALAQDSGMADVAVAQAVAERKMRLEQELAKIEQEIGAQALLLQAKQKESVSLERDVGILNAEIKKSQLSIKARDITLGNLAGDIGEKEEIIESLGEKTERQKQSLSQLIRKTAEVDEASLVEAVLGNESISEFFIDLDSFASIGSAIRISLDVIKEAKTATEGEKVVLEEKRTEEMLAKNLQVLEKKKIEKKETEKKQILTVTKGQEKIYKTVIAEKQKSAAQIRAALFELSGAKAIPFGKALEYATLVSQKTGVRPAFLLAIITQETNLGENIGTCNRPGDPPNKRWTAIMPGPNDKSSGKSRRDDQSAFQRITAELGYDPNAMPLSCPSGGGWGGAMGPSQFIPTTWESQKSKIAASLGDPIPDPWEPKDAFMASGIYLSELGAGKKTFAAEREAALRYYAGGNWNKPHNAFYGDDVMAITERHQNSIDILNGLARN